MPKKPDAKIEPELQKMLAQFNPAELLVLQKNIARLAERFSEPLDSEEEMLDVAQALMFDAMESRSKAKRIALAEEALLTSPLCADAYLMMADDDADTEDERFALLQAAVAAGEDAMKLLGYEKDAGQYWGIIETRPFMRALHALGLEHMVRKELHLAQKLFERMLKLNPNDNQGVRYILLDVLLQLGKGKDAAKLHKKYQEEYSAFWGFGGALLCFMKEGEGALATAALAKAREMNTHVAAYLSGQKKIPKRLPAYYSPGADGEAQSYVVDSMASWKSVTGALEWIKGEVLGKKML
jgi:tetratricopeptide (TPR) repeat protein